MAAQRSETLTKQEVEVMSLCLQTLCNSAAELTARQMLAAVPKSAGHPDEFVQEFIEATAVSGISDLASGRIKKFYGVAEIDVRKNRDHAELA